MRNPLRSPTLSGLIINNILHIQDEDGEWVPATALTTESIDPNFETAGPEELVPHTVKEVVTVVLERKLKAHTPSPVTELLQMQMDRAVNLHAMMIKFTGLEAANIVDDKITVDTYGNTGMKEMLIDICKVIGDPWEAIIPYIK